MSPIPGGLITPPLLEPLRNNNTVLLPEPAIGGGSGGIVTVASFAPDFNDGASPFINTFSRVSPFIYHSEPFEQRVMGLWGSVGGDSVILGKYNGYINISSTDPNVFPWDLTLSDGIIHYEPRLDYLTDVWWVRFTTFDRIGVTPSIIGTTFDTWTRNFGVVVAMTGNSQSAGGTVRINWATAANEGSIVATGWYRYDSDL